MMGLKDIARLHLIADEVQSIKQALEAGVDWVQLRMKGMSHDDMLELGTVVWELCNNHGATFIVNDHVELAVELGAHGVHLGKKDTLPSRARKILGNKAIIGGTANTLEDLIWCNEEGCDYIGLGPYRFTATKKELAPIIGECHIVDLIEAYQTRLPSGVPVVAIGGIVPEDAVPLMQMGYHGVAVSSGIVGADDVLSAAKNYLTEVENGIIKYCG